MKYAVRLSDRAAKDIDRLSRETQLRMLRRLDQIAEAPYEPRFSGALSHPGGLRKSRVGGWRIIFSVEEESKTAVERRGQVSRRI